MAVESFAELPQLNSIYHLYDRLLKSPDYQCTIEKIARKQTRGTAIAWEDAAQTAHEKILLAIQSGKFQYGSVAEFYRWSATIAHCTIIDLTRREKARPSTSLDVVVPGSNTLLIDTIADQVNLWEAIEQAELLVRVNVAIRTLDAQYPSRDYAKLWEAMILGKRQTQIANELNVTQGTVSKRWRELTQAVMDAFELLEVDAIQRQISSQQDRRDRSLTLW
jgi:RNA polymerase sigma factor (sigma-70 family)